MTTTYTTEERPVVVASDTSAWRRPRFQRLAAIAAGTGLLLSAVAIYSLSQDVDVVTKEQVPYIESQLAQVEGNVM
jgi:ribosomal protein S10